MTLSLLKILADFDTQLSSAPSIGDTTATIVSNTDDDGVTLPAGTYGFTVDPVSSAKEYIVADLSGLNLSNIKSISRQGVATTGFARGHRRGAKVVVTDWAILSRMLNNLDGTTGFNSLVKLGYDADPAMTSGDTNKFATVKYVNDTAIAGGADASSTVKGISKLSIDPVSPTDPTAVGTNDTRVPTQDENDALAGTSGSPSSTNEYVTENDTSNASTITGTGIAFVASTKTITDSGNGFVTAGFRAGSSIIVTGTSSNNGTYTVVSVSAGAIVVVETLVDESAGGSFTLTTVTANKVLRIPSNGVAPKSVDVQIFTADGTWTKPVGAKIVQVVCIGSGGGGGGGVGGALSRYGGTGGGGGAASIGIFNASLLGATETVTVPAGGAGGTGSTGGGVPGAAGSGSTSSFGTVLKAGGGGAGAVGSSSNEAGGGGGGVLSSASDATGGSPAVSANGISGQGTTATNAATRNAEYGGATGAFSNLTTGGNGGSSIYAGAGGGSGGGIDGFGAQFAGGTGGTVSAYTTGGGGTAGTVGGGNGGNGADNSTLKVGYGGAGGGGGGSKSSPGNGGNGGNGGIPGGGGGGGGGTAGTAGGNGGAGGRGEVRVYTFF